ncbi:MAG: DUF1836 domain-containing protein [Oscillospiraceae bacterium]
MEGLTNFISELQQQCETSYDKFPDIELYMDQVLSYLERGSVSSREGDKLTAAMINNYIKDDLVPRAKLKRYSRDHLASLTIVSRLKQVLSVKDMILLLREDMREKSTSEYYANFLSLLDSSLLQLSDECAKIKDDTISAAALRLAVASYVNKVACEYLIDSLAKKGTGKKGEEKPTLER